MSGLSANPIRGSRHPKENRMSPKKLTARNFQAEVLGSDQPVLVDFWAGWCGPCVAMAPSLDALASQFEGRATIGKVEIDENPEVAETYGIRSIPTLVVFKNGAEVKRFVGVTSAGELGQALEGVQS
jgi:thioredoxin 1